MLILWISQININITDNIQIKQLDHPAASVTVLIRDEPPMDPEAHVQAGGLLTPAIPTGRRFGFRTSRGASMTGAGSTKICGCSPGIRIPPRPASVPQFNTPKQILPPTMTFNV